MKLLIGLLLSISCLIGIEAKVKLPTVIGDNMVLQQQSEVKLWGKACLNASLIVETSWNKKVYKTSADKEGNWLLKVSTPIRLYTTDSKDGNWIFSFNKRPQEDCPGEWIEIEGNKAIINFDNASWGVSPVQTPLKEFEIAGVDKVFYPAFAQVNEITGCLEVFCDKVPNPVAVRYAFKNYSEATLYGIHGIPASPFRADNW